MSLFVFRITKTKWVFFSAFINAENVKLDSIVEIADIVLLLTFKKRRRNPDVIITLIHNMSSLFKPLMLLGDFMRV